MNFHPTYVDTVYSKNYINTYVNHRLMRVFSYMGKIVLKEAVVHVVYPRCYGAKPRNLNCKGLDVTHTTCSEARDLL